MPGLPNTILTFDQHYFDQIRRKVRCWGGSCCVHALQTKAIYDSLSQEERKGKSAGTRTTRVFLPVVVYTGNNVRSYGGPVELRFLDLAYNTFCTWANAQNTVNEEVAPFWERDFMLTRDTGKTMNVPVFNHLESRAKWLTDPAITAEVQRLVSEDFISKYLDCVPKSFSDAEFEDLWTNAEKSKTVAQTMVQQQNLVAQTPIAQTVATNNVQPTPQPVQVTPVVPTPVAESVAATPVEVTQIFKLCV